MAVNILELKNAEIQPEEGAILSDNGNHAWIWLGRETEGHEQAGVAANQYLIRDMGRGCLIDPRSVLDFANTVSNLARFMEPGALDYLFFSHQDPDVSSGIALWAGCTQARFLIPSVWSRFIPHFGEFDQSRAQLVPDKGDEIRLGRSQRRIVPAHFLHSLGNIVLYDPLSKLLFTGDIGAALLPKNDEYLFVENFDSHLRYMERFHRRYMVSNVVCRDFVRRVSQYSIDAIVPQHGAIIRGKDVLRFFEWFANLRCGIDLIDELYR